MRSLIPPDRDTTADLDLCIAQAGPAGANVQAHRQHILDLFDRYIADRAWDFDRAQPLDHIPQAVKNALRASYSLTYPKRSLGGLRAELLSVPDNLCPYCRLESPATLDHFLAKSLHEPFAAFAPNLVPMCRVCNTLKGTKGSAIARQFFTHAYFDQLADGERFLVAQVAVGARHIATNFAIDFSATLDANVFQRLAYQFSILRLGSRYQLAAVDLIYEQAMKLKNMELDGCGVEDRRRSLEGDARTEANGYGESYWKASLLAALAANVVFYTDGFNRAL
ncbi:MAG TPA: hypothetical protein VGB57_06440 [Allosphingosinicella sp.]